MIILDTHIWVWYLTQNEKIKPETVKKINKLKAAEKVFISSISIWEVCKLIEKNRIQFSIPLSEWLSIALSSNIYTVELSSNIFCESCMLPGEFHGDPADQMIVATSRIMEYDLITYDKKILNYKNVKSARS